MKLLFTLLITLCLGYGNIVLAENSAQSSSSNSKYTKLNDRPFGHRRNAPSKVYIICHYSVGQLSFDLPPYIEYIDITIGEETNPVWTGYADHENYSIDIPYLYGEYEITCVTDQNRTLTGTLQFY